MIAFFFFAPNRKLSQSVDILTVYVICVCFLVMVMACACTNSTLGFQLPPSKRAHHEARVTL